MEKREGQIVETPTEARQAERGPTVFNLLIISTTALVIAFAVIWFVFFRT
jgi:hypothetical protein